MTVLSSRSILRLLDQETYRPLDIFIFSTYTLPLQRSSERYIAFPLYTLRFLDNDGLLGTWNGLSFFFFLYPFFFIPIFCMLRGSTTCYIYNIMFFRWPQRALTFQRNYPNAHAKKLQFNLYHHRYNIKTSYELE